MKELFSVLCICYIIVKAISRVYLRPHGLHGTLQARIPEWVAFPFPKGSSQPRDQTQVSSTVGGFFTS